MRNGKNILFALPKNLNGSHYHRVLIPAAAIEEAGFTTIRCEDVAKLTAKQLQGASHTDVLVVNRLLTEIGSDVAYLEQVARTVKDVKIVLDLDDHWNIPTNHPDHNHQKLNQVPERVLATAQLAHLIWVSTETLAKQVRHLFPDKDVITVPNGISRYDAQFTSTPFKETDNRLNIGLFAQSKHHYDIKKLADPIAILKKVDGWRMVCVGVHPDNEKWVRHYLGMLGDERIVFRPWLPATEYATHFRHMDVLVAPLEHTVFNTYRSNLKLAECAYTDTPCFTENYGPYAGGTHTVVNWHTLFKWFRTLLRHGLDKTEFDQFIPDREAHSTDTADAIRVRSLKKLLNIEEE